MGWLLVKGIREQCHGFSSKVGCSHILLLIVIERILVTSGRSRVLGTAIDNCSPFTHKIKGIMKKQIGIIALAALFAIPAAAQEAQSRKMENTRVEGERKGEGQRFLDLPGITDQQRTQLTSIFQDVRSVNQPRQQEMRALREKLNHLKSSQNPNQNDINALIDKINGLKAEIEKTRTAGEMKARSILTPEQQQALEMKVKEHRQRWEKSENREHRMKMERNPGQMRSTEDK